MKSPHTPIPNLSPVANAGEFYALTHGDELHLDATNSTDPDGDTLMFEWDLNDDWVFDFQTSDPMLVLPSLEYEAFVGIGTITIHLSASDGELTSFDSAILDISPVPAPGAVLLSAIGLCMVGWVKRRAC